MTNPNNRSADDVIVYLPNGFSPVKPINLSELAKELMKGSFDDWTREKAINDFLSKIREAMR